MNSGLRKKDIEEILRCRFYEGNRVSLLYGGLETFNSIMNVLSDAKELICLQFYIYRADETGRRIAELLKEKVRQGVKVYLLYDHFGSFGTPGSFWKELRDSGINIGASRPFKFSAPLKYVRRDHRKLIIIDGKKAFTGGLNIANEYSGFHLRKKEPWRDTGVFVEGPVVRQLLEEFRRAWEVWTGRSFVQVTPEPLFFSDGYPCIPIFASSFRGSRRFRKLLYYSIKNSKGSIWSTVAYFVPGRRLLHSLINAARRGVDVRLLLPGISDVPAACYAGRSFYTALLRAGVRIYHYEGVVLHAKSYVFDGKWSIVGSANLDAQSLRWNDEGNLGIWSEDFGREMGELFQEDLRRSKEIFLEDWIKRPFTEKVKEKIFAIFRKRL
jgi:cardiolipin synthase